MSSGISSLTPALAPIASTTTNGSGSAGRSSGTPAANAGQMSAAVQTAAIVSLSQDSRTRAASRGEARQVDASFDKQETRPKKQEEKDEAGGSGQSAKGINVSA